MKAHITTQGAIRTILATLAILTGGLMVKAQSSFGFGGYRTLPSVEFGTAGSGNGQFEGVAGIAVDDSTGDVYVVDHGNSRVEKFDASGNYLSQFTGVETPAGSFSGYSVAVNNSCAIYELTGSECAEIFPDNGDVYVVDSGHEVVDIFDSDGKYVSQITGPSSSVPFTEQLVGVAIGPQSNIWVAESTKILHFNREGEFVASFGVDGYIDYNGLAVDEQRNAYIAEDGGRLKRFNVAGEENSEFPSEFENNAFIGYLVAVNRLTNNVIVGSRSTDVELPPFSKGGVIVQEFGKGVAGGYGYGIAVNDFTQTFYSTLGNTVSIYPEATPAKILSSGVAESRRSTAAVLGEIEPEGSSMRYRVDYGETSKYGQHSLEFEVAASNNVQAVQLGLEGLAPGKTYHYALQVSNPAGTTVGSDGTFTTAEATPPTAVTGGTSNVGLTTATVSGTIDPEGLETSYELDFGTDTTYGTSIYGEAGASSEPTELSVPLQNLAPGATYHYRLIAINSDGRTYGADQTFTTPAYSAPIVLPSALPLIGAPSIAFPTETGSVPVVGKTPTNAQKLASALKTCKKKARRSRASCEKRARKRYPVAKGKKKGKK